MLYVGIDPGLKGAIVGLSADGSPVLVWDMPRGKHGVDFAALASMMHNIKKMGIDSLYVEEPFYMPSDRVGQKGKYTLSVENQMTARINSGVVYGMAMMAFEHTKFVLPAVWKRSVGIPTGSEKKYSITLASYVFGKEASAKLHKDGRADAALIAHYGRSIEKVLKKKVKQTM